MTSHRTDPAVPAFDDRGVVVVFDGVCVLCSWWVNFLLWRDHTGRIRFTAAQGELGAALFRHYGLADGNGYSTVMVFRDGRLHTKSDRALVLLHELGWPWRAAGVLRLVPRVIRDGVYRVVARNRYRWFGRREVCRVPTVAERERFL